MLKRPLAPLGVALASVLVLMGCNPHGPTPTTTSTTTTTLGEPVPVRDCTHNNGNTGQGVIQLPLNPDIVFCGSDTEAVIPQESDLDAYNIAVPGAGTVTITCWTITGNTVFYGGNRECNGVPNQLVFSEATNQLIGTGLSADVPRPATSTYRITASFVAA
jgi:hypothetical protein